MGSEDVLEELATLPNFGSSTASPEPAEKSPMPAETPPLDHLLPASASPVVPRSPPELKPAEAAVYEAIERDETPIDRIILKCGLPTSVVSSTLFALELKKVIKQLPGKHYVRLG